MGGDPSSISKRITKYPGQAGTTAPKILLNVPDKPG
jgi:hypothetical protein